MSVGFIDKKGRFTIPRAVREALHFEPGTPIAYTCVDGELRVTRLDEPYGPVALAAIAADERGETIPLRQFIAERGIDLSAPDLPEDEGIDDD
jgi:bifunctional DNA-binding transcriptional regulator/antitoxin component of YhaV-PrlF toxin-antitoxin module